MRNQILKYHLIMPGEEVGVCVSGGVDSMVLLHVLSALADELGCGLRVLHFEHGIRGEESRRDMEFVQDAAEKLGLPISVGRANTAIQAERYGKNLEETARELRYAFFERQAREWNLDKIALAHHLNDNAETILLHLLRGCGPDGLSGMERVRGKLIRPLLGIGRAEIEEYARENNVAFREDATNADTSYMRNYLRREILPRLERVTPDPAGKICRAAGLIAEESRALSDFAGEEFAKRMDEHEGQVELDLTGWRDLPVALRRLLARLAIQRFGGLRDIDLSAVDRLAGLADANQTGKSFELPGKFFAYVSYNTLIITDKMYTIDKSGAFILPAQGRICLWPGESIEVQDVARPAAFPGASSTEQYVCGDKLAGAVVRARRPGDRIRLFGMQGRKKLKDYFIDQKIPRGMRGQIPLVAAGNEVLWIVGYALSEDLRVGDELEKVVRLNYYHNHIIKTGEQE